MARPKSLPAGAEVSLTRHRIIPGREDEVAEWMAMLNEREDECVATLDGEHMALEAVFRLTDDSGDWLYWFQLHATAAGRITGDHAIDRDHLEYARRCKVPGHVAAEPQLLLMPAPVREAITTWLAAGGSDRT